MTPPDDSPFSIARELLDELAYTAAVRDLKAHADCFSRKLRVLGVPGVDALDYDDWYVRRSNELCKPLLYSLGYRDLAIKEADDREITFSVREVMKGMQGITMVLDKDMTLAREVDGRWRVVLDDIKGVNFKE
ncbi:MAG: hypothetical protein AB7U81_10580 [Thiohalomonadaceae bacterium]